MTQELDQSVNQRFSSRLGLLLSALGIAVGTGNIWRFPRIAAQCGGEEGAGAFLVAWVVFLFLWSVPLIIAEYSLGRRSRRGVVEAFAATAGRRYAWMGAFVATVAAAIALFYAVVVGWCIGYLGLVLTRPLPGTADEALANWNTFQAGVWPMVGHAVAVGFAAWAIGKGVASIERVNKILIPSLLLIVGVSVVRALTLPGAWDGVRYLFTPQWGQLAEPRVWLEALTQNAWDTGAGWGLFLTYAAYMQSRHRVVKNAFITGIGNNIVSLLAALMIFGTVFSVLRVDLAMTDPQVLEVMQSSGPASTGLTFIWMPQLFARMALGGGLAVLFFLGLTFAGFSSLIAMLEMASRVLVDRGVRRGRAIAWVAGGCYLLGLPSVWNLDFLANQDFVWGVGLILSGAFVAFAAMRVGTGIIRREINTQPGEWHLGRWWDIQIRLFVPLAAAILLTWWLTLAATVYAPTEWYNPFNPFSVMTCLAQWGVVLGVFVLLNRHLAARSG